MDLSDRDSLRRHYSICLPGSLWPCKIVQAVASSEVDMRRLIDTVYAQYCFKHRIISVLVILQKVACERCGIDLPAAGNGDEECAVKWANIQEQARRMCDLLRKPLELEFFGLAKKVLG